MNEKPVSFSLTPMSRRKVIFGGSALTSALLMPKFAMSNLSTPATAQPGGVTMKSVQFKNGAVDMAGNLFLPDGFNESTRYPAIVSIHPGGGVKEQTAGLYAQRLAEQGFVTLAFDASHQGASGGMPRFLDDPMRRVGDIYSAVDYLTSLRYVDAGRIGALGICAGSGAAIKASSMERRIKAVGTVSAVDVGAATRKGWEGKATDADQFAMLDAVAKQRTAEAAGAAPVYVPYVPNVGDKTAPLRSSGSGRLLPDAARSAPERAEQDAADQPQQHGVVHRVRSRRHLADPVADDRCRQWGRFALA